MNELCLNVSKSKFMLFHMPQKVVPCLSFSLIRLPIIRCEFEEINAKYQMHRTLRDLASHGNSVLYPNIQINDDTLGTSYKTFSIYLKSQFVNIYQVACTIANCFVCENSN